jgi:hypothetical protein
VHHYGDDQPYQAEEEPEDEAEPERVVAALDEQAADYAEDGTDDQHDYYVGSAKARARCRYLT